MKVESRGKYPGVKLHLEPEEVTTILEAEDFWHPVDEVEKLLSKMQAKLQGLLKQEPDLLKERTPEQVAAILAKEVEKAGMQLNAVKSGKMWQKVDQDKLQAALLKHVHKD